MDRDALAYRMRRLETFLSYDLEARSSFLIADYEFGPLVVLRDHPVYRDFFTMGRRERAAHIKRMHTPMGSSTFRFVNTEGEEEVVEEEGEEEKENDEEGNEDTAQDVGAAWGFLDKPARTVQISTRPVIFLGIAGPRGVGKSILAASLQRRFCMPISEVTGSVFSYGPKHWQNNDVTLATGEVLGTTRGTGGQTAFEWHPESMDVSKVENTLFQ